MASTSVSMACPAFGGTKTVAVNSSVRTQASPVLGKPSQPVKGTFLGPLPTQQGEVNVRRFRLLHPHGAFFGRRILPRSLDIEDRAALGQQCGKLTALDPADFEMVGTHAENGGGRRTAQFRDVAGVAIQHGPSDTGRGGRAGGLR